MHHACMSCGSSSYGDIFKIYQLIPSSQLLEQIQDYNNIVTQNQEFFVGNSHHWRIFCKVMAFPSWVKIRHGKNTENTSCNTSIHIPHKRASAVIMRLARDTRTTYSTQALELIPKDLQQREILIVWSCKKSAELHPWNHDHLAEQTTRGRRQYVDVRIGHRQSKAA